MNIKTKYYEYFSLDNISLPSEYENIIKDIYLAELHLDKYIFTIDSSNINNKLKFVKDQSPKNLFLMNIDFKSIPKVKLYNNNHQIIGKFPIGYITSEFQNGIYENIESKMRNDMTNRFDIVLHDGKKYRLRISAGKLLLNES
jgi:hypothetical protein